MNNKSEDIISFSVVGSMVAPATMSQKVEIVYPNFFYPKFLVPPIFLFLRLAGENSFLVTFGLYLAKKSCFVRNYHIKIK